VTTTSAIAHLPGRRRLLYGCTGFILALSCSFLALLGVDIYLHGKFQKSAGFNVWGYRGPVVGRKAAGEYRVVVLGGSSAYGYGTSWDEAIPATLERQFAGRGVGPFLRIRVINLAYNNEGAYSFKFTLKDYAYLNYDLVCLYEGYNDLQGDPRGPNLAVFRHDSPVFRLTGYLPIFPMIFNEKAAALLAGNVDGLYHPNGKTVFRPGVAAQAAAGVLRTTAGIGQSLERQLDRATAEPPRGIDAVDTAGCKYPWGQYCRSIADAIQLAVAGRQQVLFVTQPYENGEWFRARHMEQQREASSMIGRMFSGNADVGYVNLGDVVDLGDPLLSYDRMHLTAPGNFRIAQALVGPVTEMAQRRAASTSAKHQ
jgi:hypothetical protein